MSKRCVLAGILLMLNMGCASLEGAIHKSIFQSFGYGNDGVGAVTDVEIQYGKLYLPTAHTDKERIGPARFHAVRSSETQDSEIPEQAQASWISADGKRHTATLPIRALIPDMGEFKGFDFYFVDDHLDVYLRALGPKGAKFQEVHSTKVYSTSP